MRGDPRGNIWEEMMADLKEGTQQKHHSAAGNDLPSALSCLYLEPLLFNVLPINESRPHVPLWL